MTHDDLNQGDPRHPPMRVGHGYDLHRLEPIARAGKENGRDLASASDTGQRAHPLIIGGVRFEHDLGPVGHSDGDVLLHAVTDAILGALALPDIGQFFPDTDPRWAGADSGMFLKEASKQAGALGWSVANIDATVVLEQPKVGPRKEEIRRNIASLLGIEAGQVNVKAKTHEGVDAVGSGRAIEAHAVVLLVR